MTETLEILFRIGISAVFTAGLICGLALLVVAFFELTGPLMDKIKRWLDK